MTGIYFIQSISKPERVYVGSAVDTVKRFRWHKSDLKLNKHANPKLQRHFNKYGKDDLRFVPITIVNTKEDLIKVEQDFIDMFEPYFNIRIIAESNLGIKYSDESKRKLSEARVGKKFSSEHKHNLSESHKGIQAGERNPMFGKKHSDETKQKIYEKALGRNPGEETRKKMSESRAGEKHPQYDHTIYRFIHPEHGERFCTQYELRKEFNLHQGHLSSVIRCEVKTIKGWRVK